MCILDNARLIVQARVKAVLRCPAPCLRHSRETNRKRHKKGIDTSLHEILAHIYAYVRSFSGVVLAYLSQASEHRS